MRSSFSILRRAPAALALALAAVVAACGGGGGGSDDGDTGQLAVRLTDGQSCSHKRVFVTVERVRVHRSADADPAGAGWSELALSPPRRVDLMTLRNGVFEDLGSLPLEAGRYSQIRLVLAANGNAAPYANELTLADDRVVALRTPSGAQSGLKLNAHITIEAGTRADLVLDFDPCRSVVSAGNSGRYLLKPVVTAYAQAVNDIAGYTLPGAGVSAQQGGVALKSTVADASGRFVLWPVTAGSYDVVITAPGRVNAVLAGVAVDQGTTVVSGAATPLVPASSPAAARAAGSVSVAGASEIEAGVRAQQALPGGPTIEVAQTPVDAETGGWSFTLPLGAPERADWSQGVLAYGFAPADAAAGLYRLEATAAGVATPKAADVDLNGGDVEVGFSFP